MALSIITKTGTNIYVMGGNPIRFTVATNNLLSGSLVKPQFRIYAIVDRVNEDNSLTIIARCFGVPSPTDTQVISSQTYYRCHFDLSSYILSDVIQFATGIPTTGVSQPHKYRYRVSFFEYDLGAIIPPVALTNTFFVVPGGFKVVRNYDFTFQGIFVNPTPRRFLLTQTQARINANTRLPLCFAPDGGNNEVILNYTYIDDGIDVSGSITLHNFGGVGSPFFMRCFVFRLDSINWLAEIGVTPDYSKFFNLSITVLNQFSIAIVAALPITLVEPTPFNRTFYYQNSYGVLVPFICNGRRLAKNQITSQMAELSPNNSNTQTSKLVKGSLVQYNQENTTEYLQHTGHLPVSIFSEFEDFMRSPVKYELVNGYYYPIIVNSKDYDSVSDDQTIFNHSFKYIYAQNEKYI